MSRSFDLLGYQVRYESVGYGKFSINQRHFRGSGRKMPNSWEKTCYAVFINDIFVGSLHSCRNKWVLISVIPDQTSPCMCSGQYRNDAVLQYINRYLIDPCSDCPYEMHSAACWGNEDCPYQQ